MGSLVYHHRVCLSLFRVCHNGNLIPRYVISAVFEWYVGNEVYLMPKS